MASHLVASGYDVAVHDLRDEAVQVLQEKGATGVNTPRARDAIRQERFISFYLYICMHYKTHLWMHAQRLSNNNRPEFTMRIWYYAKTHKETLNDYYAYS